MDINKLGAYLYRKFTDKGEQPEKPSNPSKKMSLMWYEIYSWINKQCKAINAEYSKYKKTGNFSKVCQQKEIRTIEINVSNTSEEETEIY